MFCHFKRKKHFRFRSWHQRRWMEEVSGCNKETSWTCLESWPGAATHHHDFTGRNEPVGLHFLLEISVSVTYTHAWPFSALGNLSLHFLSVYFLICFGTLPHICNQETSVSSLHASKNNLPQTAFYRHCQFLIWHSLMNLGFEVCDRVNYVIHAMKLLTLWCLMETNGSFLAHRNTLTNAHAHIHTLESW